MLVATVAVQAAVADYFRKFGSVLVTDRRFAY
jgi:hypothetical protein